MNVARRGLSGFLRVFEQPDRQAGEEFLKRWCFWATHNRLNSIIKAAKAKTEAVLQHRTVSIWLSLSQETLILGYPHKTAWNLLFIFFLSMSK
jgi:hypothetical protein